VKSASISLNHGLMPVLRIHAFVLTKALTSEQWIAGLKGFWALWCLRLAGY